MSGMRILFGQPRLILAITLVYLVAWFAYYSQIPAGQFPGEAERATLHAAQTLADGSSTPASGHSLYTYLLSGLARFFQSNESLLAAARVLNACALLLATHFSAAASGRYWRRNHAAWIAGLLVGLNPVLIFWTGNISPSLLATACISIALWHGLRWLRHPRAYDSLGCALSLTLAALFETSLLPFALLWLLLACLYPKREHILHGIAALSPLLLLAGILSLSDLQLENPWFWNFESIAANAYAVLGNSEGYDGKSFALYRKLHLLLFLNPIHWGALCILAGIGCYLRFKEGFRGHSVWLGIGAFGIFVVSLALNQGGSQARACFIPLLALAAAGIGLLPKIWLHASRRTRYRIIGLGSLLGLVTYSVYLSSAPSKTWARDYVYLAEANIHLGHSARATTWAKKALELDPTQNEMREILILAQFNDWAISNQQHSLPIETAKDYLAAVQAIETTPTTQSIQAIYQYKLREQDTAQTIWRAARDKSALALICLYWTGEVNDITTREIESYSGDAFEDLLRATLAVNRNALTYSSLEKQLDNMLAYAY